MQESLGLDNLQQTYYNLEIESESKSQNLHLYCNCRECSSPTGVKPEHSTKTAGKMIDVTYTIGFYVPHSTYRGMYPR